MYVIIKLREGAENMIGLKEIACMELERYADIERIDVIEEYPKQLRMGDGNCDLY